MRNTTISDQELDHLTHTALDEFWEVIVSRFPEATSGDLSPLTTMALRTTAKDAVDEWIAYNVSQPLEF